MGKSVFSHSNYLKRCYVQKEVLITYSCPLDKTKCRHNFTGPTKLEGSHSLVPYYNYFSYMLVSMQESENITDGNFSFLRKLDRMKNGISFQSANF